MREIRIKDIGAARFMWEQATKLMALGFIRRKPNPDVNHCSAFTVYKPHSATP